ncbi:MAG: Zn-ribbon domain-containing OB-fold protein [Caldisericaceae bacterium]|nr:Zn-ribbon domain-containing OB-fold protein [Caldisericaceae bacterium]
MITIQDYINGLKKGKILGSKCKKCGNLMIPPKPVCSKCGSFDVEEVETTGKGVIRSFTVIYVAPEKFEDKAPYVVVLVSLNEGGAVMGRLIGVDPTKPEDIKIGAKVKFKPLIENGEQIVAFEPV